MKNEILPSVEIVTTFTPLEVVLMAAIVSVVGGIILLARLFYQYLTKTNQERAEEIKAAARIQAMLEKTIEQHNEMLEKLPDRLEKTFLMIKHRGL